MVYFKKYELPQYSPDQIENGLRKASLKRTSSLEMLTPSYNIGTDKSFFGYEGKNDLTFTRIKTSFEKMLPKVIIRLKPNNEYYDVRLGLPASLLFLLFCIGWILNLIYLLVGKTAAEAFFFYTVITGIYFSLVLFELKLTTVKVNKAIIKVSE